MSSTPRIGVEHILTNADPTLTVADIDADIDRYHDSTEDVNQRRVFLSDEEFFTFLDSRPSADSPE